MAKKKKKMTDQMKEKRRLKFAENPFKQPGGAEPVGAATRRVDRAREAAADLEVKRRAAEAAKEAARETAESRRLQEEAAKKAGFKKRKRKARK